MVTLVAAIIAAATEFDHRSREARIPPRSPRL